MYDPTLGQFISRDPISYKGGMDLYGYASDRPVVAVDPSGLLVKVLLHHFSFHDPIAALDSQVVGGQPHQSLADGDVNAVNAELAKKYAVRYASPANSGPKDATSADGKQMAASYLFFLSFLVCEAPKGDAHLFLDESGTKSEVESMTTSKGKNQCDITARGMVEVVKVKPIREYDTAIIFVDMPFISTDKDDLGNWGYAKKTVKQRFDVKDGAGNTVNTVYNSMSIVINEKGETFYSP